MPIDFVIRAGRHETIDDLRAFTARRLSFALRRFAHRIHHLTVRFVDENGPRRGVDSRCSMTAQLTDGRQVFVDATAAWPYAAINEAASRLNEAIRRELKRRIGHR